LIEKTSTEASRLAEDMPEEPTEADGSDYPVPDLPTTSAEEPLVASIEKDDDQQSQSESSIYEESAEDLKQELVEQILLPAREPTEEEAQQQPNDMAAPGVDLAALAATVAALQEQLRGSRGTTPAQSVFGGSAFAPSGPAALPAFAPYIPDGGCEAANPHYDRKARKTGIEPGKFDGKKEEFDTWVTKLSDNFTEDADTFKNERSRMAVINANTEGPANDLLRARYDPLSKNPFKNACEMVATLAAVYFDNNQSSKAREELRKMMYDPTDKTIDIHQYIGKINSLADRANIILEERKSTLLEHIPANLDPRLLSDSKDPSVSYETFANLVADAALSQHRAYLERRERKAKRDGRTSPQQTRKLRRERDVKTKAAVNKPLATDGACFGCGKTGHRIRDCPEAKKIASVYKAMKKEGAFLPSEEEDSASSTPTSPSSSGSETDSGDSEN